MSQNDTPVDTKPDNGPPASAVSDERPVDDGPERFAELVAKAFDARFTALVAIEAHTGKAVRDLADAFNQHTTDLQRDWDDAATAGLAPAVGTEPLSTPVPEYRHPRKNWRLKRGAVPQWYKQKAGIRTKAQSGAARVARHRPKRWS